MGDNSDTFPLVDPELAELDQIEADLGLKDSDDIWLPGSDDAAKLRVKLNDGRLARVMKDYFGNLKQKGKSKRENGRLPFRVDIILLGTCAVALGCKLPRPDLIKYIKDNRHTMGLSKQMKDKILEICQAYSEGEYYEDIIAQDSAEDDEDMEDADDSTIAVHPASTPGPATPELEEDDEDASSTAEEEYPPTVNGLVVQKSLPPSPIPTPSKFTLSGCFQCGSRGHSDGMPLLRCGACAQVVYCDVKCQRKHFDDHKKSCKGIVRESLGASKVVTPTRESDAAAPKRKGPGNPNLGKKKAKKAD